MTSNPPQTSYEFVKSIFNKNLQPEPILTVSEWAATNRRLTTKSSSEPGPWQNERTPYLVEIMNCLSINHPAEKIVFKKASQIGGTECGNNWLGYIIDHAPAPTMLVLPTIDLAKRTSNQRISELMESSPSLKIKMAEEKSRSKSNTLLMKDFPGGILVISGANSASSLKSTPTCNLFFDEIDEFVDDLDGQGDPISLAMVRSRAFARSKAFLVSTPTVDGASKIDDEFEASDKRFYNVPCPHCNKKQAFVFENLKWTKGVHHSALYFCEHCGEGIEEFEKVEMLRKGEWIATATSDTPGFHLNTIYSPWYSWAKIARDYELAMKEIDEEKKTGKMRVFTNTVKGLTWKESGEAPEWKRLYERRELYPTGTVPERGVLLTCGVDVQKDRLEMEVVAWAEGAESWSVDYNIIMGDTNLDETWNQLGVYIQKTFPHHNGQELPIQLTAVDSGYNTQKVYAFCRRYPVSRVIAVKGTDSSAVAVHPPQAVDLKIDGKTHRRGIKIWKIGTSLLKSELYSFLRQNMVDALNSDTLKGYCHFPQYSEEFFKQLCAEEMRVKKNRKNQEVYEWVKVRERNESLDTRIMARSCSIVLGIDRFKQRDWDARKVKAVAKPLQTVENGNSPTKSQESSKRKSKARRSSDYWS